MTTRIAGERAVGPEIEVASTGAEAWDRYVIAHADATHAHLAGWLSVFGDALGHETVPLVARDASGGVAGLLPLVWVRSAVFGRYLVSMPILDSGGPLVVPGAAPVFDALTAAAASLAHRGRADLLELRTGAAGHTGGLSAVQRKVTVTLPLPGRDALWEALPSKVRSQIRRPQHAGYAARFGVGERDAFHHVYARHLRDLGSPAHGRALFDVIASALAPSVEFAVVYDRSGQPVAGGCGFAFRDRFTLVWAAALRRASTDAPNMLLYWSLMERAIARGLRTFDFGRCSPGSGTHRFKRQWGGVDAALTWLQWPTGARAAMPATTERRYRLASAVWRRLPPIVTRACGPPLARLIP